MTSIHVAPRRLSMASKAVALTIAAVLPSVALAQERYTTDAPLELRKVMQTMGRHLQGVADGISREDWEQVARLAALIAEHDRPPPSEQVKVLGFLGRDVPAFKASDDAVHKSGLEMRAAAAAKDGSAAIAAFARVQTACLACHQQFREPLVRHFYKAP